jgi:uncharacterized membrane protein YgcG
MGTTASDEMNEFERSGRDEGRTIRRREPDGAPGWAPDEASTTTTRASTTTWMSHVAGGVLSPIWWLSLVVLVVNDHFAKAAHPGWVTGKMSDLAGLVVAPVVLAALLGTSHRGRRALAFAAVVIPFAAIKLSPVCADALVSALGLLGLSWRIVVDPTDLLALVILPLAWHVAEPGAARDHLRSRAFERTGLVLGAAACLASGENEPGTWHTTTFLYNATDEAVGVHVRPYDGEIDCAYFEPLRSGFTESVVIELSRALDPGAFAEGILFHIQPRNTLSLSPQTLRGAANDGSFDGDGPPFGEACGVLLVQAEGMRDFLIWTDTNRTVQVRLHYEEMDESLAPARIDIVGTRGHLDLASYGPRIAHTMPHVEPGSCGVVPPAWSWSPPNGHGTIESIEPLGGGCLEVRFVNDEGSGGGGGSAGAGGGGGTGGLDGVGGSDVGGSDVGGSDVGGSTGEGAGGASAFEPAPKTLLPLRLCAPGAAFPFEVGDQIVFDTFLDGATLSVKSASAELTVVRAGASHTHPLFGSRVVTEGCIGSRSLCGAYEVPAQLGIHVGDEEFFLSSGETLEVVAGGATATIAAGRATWVVAAPAGCDENRRTTGLRHDLSITR